MNPIFSPEEFENVKKWLPFILTIIAGGASSILSSLLLPSFPLMAPVFGFGFGFVGMLLLISWLKMLLSSFFSSLSESINNQFSFVVQRVEYTERELRSMVNVRPLLGDTLLPFGMWAIGGRFAEILVELIREITPELVVECGSGTSTVLAAECLKRQNNGRLLALEHDNKYADITRRYLTQTNLNEIASVVEAPLREWRINGQAADWYGFDPEAYLTQSIDLLIVDGPPGKTTPKARYPAVPLLKKWLSPNGVIILDDGNREDEKEIAKQWIDELNATYEFYPEGKGIWVIRTGENHKETTI